jgi:signal transduction histidine kinase/ligand-binding sensor domain-containing protein
MGKIKLNILLIILFISSNISFGFTGAKKEMVFESINGLTNLMVNHVYQDHEGFLWVSSWGGLNRYDGYKFKEYKFDEYDTNTISSRASLAVVEDSKNRLWVFCNYGICLFNRDKENFTRFYYNAENPTSLIGNDISTFLLDKKGRLWIGTHREGLCMLEVNNNTDFSKTQPRFKHYYYNEHNPKSISGEYIYSIFEDSNGNIWVSANNRIIDRYNENKDNFDHFNINNYKIYEKTDFVAIQHEEKEGIFWFTTLGSGFFSWNTTENTLKQYENQTNKNSVSFNYIRHLKEDQDGLLWLATDGGGISYFDRKTQSFEYSQNEPGRPTSLSSNSVYYIFDDRSGVRWLATYNGGINKVDRYKTFFKTIQPDPFNKNCLNNKSVLAVIEDREGNLWIGTDGGGLNYLDKKTGKYIYYVNDPNNQNSIGSNAVIYIKEDFEGNLWLGTYGGGLNYFNKKTKKFTQFLNDRSNQYSISHNDVWVVEEDDAHNIWSITLTGVLNIYNRQNGNFYHYHYNESDTDSYRELYPTAIYKDSRKNIWISSTNGLQMTDLKKADLSQPNPKLSFKFFSKDSTNQSINSNSIFSISEDPQGNMWFGTDEGWLDKLDVKTMKFSYFTDKSSLLNTGIRATVFDNNNNIWIATVAGLWYYNTLTNHFRSFDINDGLQDMNFGRGSCKTKDGTIYITGPNGMNAFDPSKLPLNTTKPPVVITELRIFNNPVKVGEKIEGNIILKNSITETDEVVLPYGINFFSLEFSALDFTLPEKNKYSYKLIGFDKQWHFTDAKNRIATYTNLDAGKYIFMVKGSNNDNIWNDYGTTLTIQILPPWWGTWWFRIILVLIIVGGIITYFRLKTQILRIRQAELKKLVEMRTAELLNSNKKLTENKIQLEEQSIKLQAQSENLINTNNLLVEKQNLILEQTEQLRKTNEQLSLLNATKDKFFSIIAHDLRNPFNVLMGLSEIMYKGNNLSAEKMKKYSEIIYVSSKSGYNLLENLLQWSRSQTGNITFEPTIINLQNIAEETIELLEGAAERKNLTINQEIGPEITAFADEIMIQTILRNLISNAIKFSNENGIITISAVNTNNLIEICVEDNGIGISEDALNKLFKVDTTISTKGTLNETGTGLGLLLCKEFVDKHNGRLWVESQVKVGSKFKFTIPTP